MNDDIDEDGEILYGEEITLEGTVKVITKNPLPYTLNPTEVTAFHTTL